MPFATPVVRRRGGMTLGDIGVLQTPQSVIDALIAKCGTGLSWQQAAACGAGLPYDTTEIAAAAIAKANAGAVPTVAALPTSVDPSTASDYSGALNLFQNYPPSPAPPPPASTAPIQTPAPSTAPSAPTLVPAGLFDWFSQTTFGLPNWGLLLSGLALAGFGLFSGGRR